MPILHPRIAQYGQYWRRMADEQRRLTPGVISSVRPKADRPLWVDYYPWAVGTVPEKMIFAELISRGITFFFAPYWGDMPFTSNIYEHYRPDFVLPEYRIVIEVYGTYWHTIPGAAGSDARRAVLYEASGFKYYHLWDYQIYDSPSEALDTIPELVNPAVRTGRVYISDRPFDPTASLRARGRKLPKVVRLRVAVRGAPAMKGLYPAVKPRLRPPKRVPTPTEAGFQGLSRIYRQELEDYGYEWKDYMDELQEFFGKWGARAQKAYPQQYKYWLRWRDWWERWKTAMFATPQWFDYIEKLGDYFRQFPTARWRYTEEYYRWLRWRRMGHRRI